MNKRISTNWGKWIRVYQREKSIDDEIQRISRISKRWTIAAIILIILFASLTVIFNYIVGSKISAKIDASTQQILNMHKESIQQTLKAINPNDFIFKPFEDSEWYLPTPINEYVTLNVLPVKRKEISFYFSIKNRSEFAARNVYCVILFSNNEFFETGDNVANRLQGLDGLNVYNVNSSDDYLNEAVAFEWMSIPPKTPMTVRRRIDLTMKGNTARLTVKINSANRISFEFALQESRDGQ